MLNFAFHNPTKIIFGKGEVLKSGEIISEFGKKALIVTGRSSTKKTGVLDKVVESLKQAGVDSIVFNRVEPNPRAETVDEGGHIARENHCEVIVGLGGGSAMDAAKQLRRLQFQACQFMNTSEVIQQESGKNCCRSNKLYLSLRFQH